MKKQIWMITALLVNTSLVKANADQRISFESFQTAAQELVPEFNNRPICKFEATLMDEQEMKLAIGNTLNGYRRLEILVNATTDPVVSYVHLDTDYTNEDTYTFANGNSLKTKYTDYYEEIEISDGKNPIVCYIEW